MDAKELAEHEARAADDYTVRTMKEAKKLMGKPDLLERAAAAHQRLADCADRMKCLVASYDDGAVVQDDEPPLDVLEAASDMMAAGEAEFVIYCAMDDDEKKRWYAAGRRFYEANPLAQKPPVVIDLLSAEYD